MLFMPRGLPLLILGLLLFRCAIGGMPVWGKAAGSSKPQKGLSRNLDDPRNQGKNKKPPFVPGEVLVKFKVGVTKEGIDKIRMTYGLSCIITIESIGVYRFRIPPGSTVEDMVDALNEDSQVEYAEPNYMLRIQR